MKQLILNLILLFGSIMGISAQEICVTPRMTPAGGTHDDFVNVTCTFPEGCAGGKYWFNGGEIKKADYTTPIYINKSCRLSIAGVNAEGHIITDVVSQDFTINNVTPPFVTPTPQENSLRESFYATTLTWNYAESVSLDISAFKEGGSRRGENVIWLTYDKTNEIIAQENYNALWVSSTNNYKAYLYKNYRPTAHGSYTLHIAGGIFTVNGQLYEDELAFTYFVGEDGITAPIFTPAPGTYEDKVSVSIQYPTNAFYKFYKINGGSIKQYNDAPFTIDATSTIEAWGRNTDYTEETQHSTATYTIVAGPKPKDVLPEPEFALNGDVVTITESDANAVIKYWFDDKMQTARLYTGPITVTKNGRISAVAYRENGISPTVDFNITHFPEDESNLATVTMRTPDTWASIILTGMSANGRFVCGHTDSGQGNPYGFIWDINSGKGEYISNNYYSQTLGVSNDGTIYGWHVGINPITGEMLTDDDSIVEGYYRNGEWSANPTGMEVNTITSNNLLVGSYNGKPATYDINTGNTTVFGGGNGSLYCGNADGSILAGYVVVDGEKTAAYWQNPASPVTIATDKECYVKAISGNANWLMLDNKEWGEYSPIVCYRHNVATGNTEKVESMGARYPSRYEWLSSITDEGTMYGVYDPSLLSHDAGAGLAYTADGSWREVKELLFERGANLEGLNVLASKYVSADENTFVMTVFPEDMSMDDGYTYAIAVKFNTKINHSQPTGLKATQVYGMKNVKLEWESPMFDADKVENYRIIRNGETLATTTECHYFDTTVEKDMTYTYSVVARYKDGVESEPSFESTITIVLEGHLAARNLSLRQSGINDVNLSWTSPIISLPKMQYFKEESEFSAFGTAGYNSEWAIRIPKSDLEVYEGMDIRTFQFLPTGPQESYEIRLYNGTIGSNYNPTPFYTQEIDPMTLNYGTVNTIMIETPQSLPTSNDLYVALYIQGKGDDNMLGVSHEGFRAGYTDLCKIDDVHSQFISIAEESATTTEIVVPLGIGLANDESIKSALVENYEVSNNGVVLGTTEGVTYRSKDVAEGEHTFSVRVLYQDGEYSEPCSITADIRKSEKAFVPVSNINIDVNSDNTATVTWDAPMNDDPTEIHWGDLTPSPGLLNAGYDIFAIGAVYPVTMTSQYAEAYEISHLFYYPTAEANFYLSFDDNAENILYEGAHEPVLNQINYVELPEPITVDQSTNYRFLISVSDCPVGEAPVAFDSSMSSVDYFSNLLNVGLDWMTLTEVMQIGDNPNWLMGMVVRQKDAQPMPLTGYNVIIDGNQANASALQECAFTTGPLSEGHHKAIVDVVYDPTRTVSSEPQKFTIATEGIENIYTNDNAPCYDIEGRRIIKSKAGKTLFIIGNKKYANK